MRKNISVTNEKVLNLLENSINASEVIEVAILYYLGELTKEYVDSHKSLQEVLKVMQAQKNKPKKA